MAQTPIQGCGWFVHATPKTSLSSTSIPSIMQLNSFLYMWATKSTQRASSLTNHTTSFALAMWINLLTIMHSKLHPSCKLWHMKLFDSANFCFLVCYTFPAPRLLIPRLLHTAYHLNATPHPFVSVKMLFICITNATLSEWPWIARGGWWDMQGWVGAAGNRIGWWVSAPLELEGVESTVATMVCISVYPHVLNMTCYASSPLPTYCGHRGPICCVQNRSAALCHSTLHYSFPWDHWDCGPFYPHFLPIHHHLVL